MKIKRFITTLILIVLAAPVWAQSIPATQIQGRTNTGTNLGIKIVFTTASGIPVMRVVDDTGTVAASIKNTGVMTLAQSLTDGVNLNPGLQIEQDFNPSVNGGRTMGLDMDISVPSGATHNRAWEYGFSISVEDAGNAGTVNFISGGEAYAAAVGSSNVTTTITGLLGSATRSGSGSVDLLNGGIFQAELAGTGTARGLVGVQVDASVTTSGASFTGGVEGIEVTADGHSGRGPRVFGSVISAQGGSELVEGEDIQANATSSMTGALKGSYIDLEGSTNTITGGEYGIDIDVETDKTSSGPDAYGVNVEIHKNSMVGAGLFTTAYAFKGDVQNATTAYGLYITGQAGLKNLLTGNTTIPTNDGFSFVGPGPNPITMKAGDDGDVDSAIVFSSVDEWIPLTFTSDMSLQSIDSTQYFEVYSDGTFGTTSEVAIRPPGGEVSIGIHGSTLVGQTGVTTGVSTETTAVVGSTLTSMYGLTATAIVSAAVSSHVSGLIGTVYGTGTAHLPYVTAMYASVIAGTAGGDAIIYDTAVGVNVGTMTVTGAGSSIAAGIGIRVEDQTAASVNYAIKTGLGLVDFGDAVHAVNLTTTQDTIGGRYGFFGPNTHLDDVIGWGSVQLNAEQDVVGDPGYAVGIGMITTQTTTSDASTTVIQGYYLDTHAILNHDTQLFGGHDFTQYATVASAKTVGTIVNNIMDLHTTGSGAIIEYFQNSGYVELNDTQLGSGVQYYSEPPSLSGGATVANWYSFKGADLSGMTVSGVKQFINYANGKFVVDSAGSLTAHDLNVPEVAFAGLPGSPAIGTIANISDSNTVVWGANAAGSGSNHVQVRWNGTNWTVVGK